jgi:hypothetical protein
MGGPGDLGECHNRPKRKLRQKPTRLRDEVCVEQGLGADRDGVEEVVLPGARKSGAEIMERGYQSPDDRWSRCGVERVLVQM